MWERGLGGYKQDDHQALKYYQNAVKGGCVEAIYRLGYLYENGGCSLQQDYEQARKNYEIAAEKGCVDARYRLGQMYEFKRGVERDYAAAVRYYKAAGHNCGEAMASLGYISERGLHTGARGEPNVPDALRLYTEAAKLGNPVGRRRRASMLERGCGCKKDYEEAFRLYEQAAAQGDAEAIYSLARFYENGCGTPKNLDEAYRLYRKAAELNCADAQHEVGKIYESGLGGYKQDKEQALIYYKKAYQNGCAAAWNSYGALCGETGKYEDALKCFQKAAESGNATALCNLGLLYESGKIDGYADRAKAIECYTQAADLGDPNGINALTRLGVRY
jgi:TPR repeat protein